jgi:gluconate 2-dehydrogenase gamma chain
MTEAQTTRRSILQAAAFLGLSLATPADWDLLAAVLQHAPAGAPPARAGAPLFDPAEMADVEAIASQIVPTDTTPGAREAGAAQFIDRALGSFFAPLAPEFRAGLAEFRAGVRKRFPESAAFASLSHAQQVEWLQSIERSPFFALMRQLTVLGMFSNPSYGGNRDGIGWQLLGFRDEHVFMPPFGHYDRDYPGFRLPEGEAR